MFARITRWLTSRERPESRINRGYRSTLRASPHPTTGALISLVLPVHDTPASLLAACIASVRAQTYQDWQLCIADDASQTPPALPADTRILTTRLATNCGIAAATNAALALATGALVAFIDHDDLLAPHALAAMADAARRHPEAGLLFSDEDQLVAGRHVSPYFKPGWNPDLLHAQNMVGHLAVYRRALLDRIGPLRPGIDGSQDWELALRAAGQARPHHVPTVAYHWRQRPGSFSATRTQAARAAGLRAVQAHLPPGALAVPAPGLPQWVRVIYPVPDAPPLVSLVAPDGVSVPGDADYTNTERVARPEQARGGVLVFLAPGLRAARAGWLRELVSQALRPEVGAAGGRIDRPDGRIAQAGLFLHPVHVAETLHPASDAGDPGYRGQFCLARSVSVVSLDCLAIRRSVLEEAGGLDEACGPYADVDLCLKLAARGLRCVWTPYARLCFARGARRRVYGAREAAALMQARWGEALARDPYLNPNLVLRRGNLNLADAAR